MASVVIDRDNPKGRNAASLLLSLSRLFAAPGPTSFVDEERLTSRELKQLNIAKIPLHQNEAFVERTKEIMKARQAELRWEDTAVATATREASD